MSGNVAQPVSVPSKDEGSQKKPVAVQLVSLAEENSAKFFRDQNDEPCVKVNDNTFRINSAAYRSNLKKRFFDDSKSLPSAQAMDDAIGLLSAKAEFAEDQEEVFVRVGFSPGNIYHDISDGKCGVIQISSEGWSKVDQVPISFIRSKGMLPLVVPKEPSTNSEVLLLKFRRLLNLDSPESEDTFLLIMAWILGCFVSAAPYCLLVMIAEQGSGKSTIFKVLRMLIDPRSDGLRREPKNGHDLFLAARNCFLLGYDNFSRLTDELSDDLCRLATGAAMATRKLYSDFEESVQKSCRPVMLNGISEFANRGDLISRSIVVSLPRIPDEKRRTEKDLYAEFESIQPELMGLIYGAVSHGLRSHDSTELARMPRMADSWKWIVSCEAGLGIRPGSMLDAFWRSQKVANEAVLATSPIYPILKRIALNGWTGTALKLLDLVRLDCEGDSYLRRIIPQSPRSLADHIRRLAPALRESGIAMEFSRTGDERLMTFQTLGKTSSQSSSSSRNGAANDDHDEDDEVMAKVSDAQGELLI